MAEIEQTPHTEFDCLHAALMNLLDRIDTQDDPSLTKERFAILERHGHRISIFTGPKLVTDNG